MFVSKDRVPVRVEGDDTGDTIYILPKMPFGTKQRALSALSHIGTDGTSEGTGIDIDLGAYNIALMKLNIVGWEGPSFAGVACTPENIEQLDPDEPLVVRVLEEIGRRNPVRRDAESPNAPAPAGDTSSTAKGRANGRENGTHTSATPLALVGRPSK